MRIFSLIIFSLVSAMCCAQLTIDNTTYTRTQLVSTILAPAGNGVTISNVSGRGVYNVSSRYQVGYFSAAGSVQTNLGLASGVVLTSGNTSEIPLSPLTTDPGSAAQLSRNYTSGTTGEIRSSNAAAGQDADVAVLVSPDNYYNASILEFDFIPANTNISFRYVFGSEEYMDNSGSINYNCSSYNDKFAFLISGPGISSPAGYANNAQNIAILFNGATVSINSVNNGIVGSSGGAPSASRCSAANPAWVQNTVSTEYKGIIYGINFNGNTKVLTASRSGLTAGATYHIRMIVTDVGDGAYDSGVFIEANSFTSPITLPVEFATFENRCNGGNNQLHWQTSLEYHNARFQIERSTDGLRYETIGSIKGSGNSSEPVHYDFIDYNSNNGAFYYRIKQIDLDGNYTYSSILFAPASCASQHLSILKLFPNPAKNTTHLFFKPTDSYDLQLEISNNLGQPVLVKNYSLGENQDFFDLELNTSEFAEGLYFVSVKSGQIRACCKLIITN